MSTPSPSLRAWFIALALGGALGWGCGTPPSATDVSPEPSEVPEPPPAAGPIPDSWVEARVSAAEERLNRSEAGALVLEAIQAHGGLTSWLGAGTIRFTFDYHPVDESRPRRHTESHVDLWRSRARQDVVDSEVAIGWDGETAWEFPNAEAFPGSARFWATTPYYFVGVPFVFADPGTRFERLPDSPLAERDAEEGSEAPSYHLVKITYEDGTGDSPDDYYILYVDPNTKRVRALRYVVAYPGFFPEGGHTPEKLMRYEGEHEVQGLVMPSSLPTYAFDLDRNAPTDLVTNITVADIALGDPIEASRFRAPEGASTTTAIETD